MTRNALEGRQARQRITRQPNRTIQVFADDRYIGRVLRLRWNHFVACHHSDTRGVAFFTLDAAVSYVRAAARRGRPKECD